MRNHILEGARHSKSMTWRRDLAIVLRRYGFLGFNMDEDGAPISDGLRATNASLESPSVSVKACSLIIADRPDIDQLPGVDSRSEEGSGFLYEPGRLWPRPRKIAYRPLLPHISFSGKDLTPVWTTQCGRTVIGWWNRDGRHHLLVGLRVAEEMVRYTQGDPSKVVTATDKALWGFAHERPTYLFTDNIVSGQELVPWADRLGFTLARLLAQGSEMPLIAPLPDGAAGGVLLTGDDDQAYIEKYDEQVRLLDGFPITYFMLPQTRHTTETLAKMPKSVEFGIHIDALDSPSAYRRVCREQTLAVRRLIGSPARAVRNHGHLNDGYWGHLAAWEECGLAFDVNVRGLDGTCPTGSYLPFRVRRPDGSWSSHVSLFSTFSDGMLYVQKWPQAQQIACITRLAGEIELSHPGVLVFNFHPQNVGDFHDVHRAVMALGRRKGWVAFGAQSYLEWLSAVDDIRLTCTKKGFELRSPNQVERLGYFWPKRMAGTRLLPKWNGAVSLR